MFLPWIQRARGTINLMVLVMITHHLTRSDTFSQNSHGYHQNELGRPSKLLYHSNSLILRLKTLMVATRLFHHLWTIQSYICQGSVTQAMKLQRIRILAESNHCGCEEYEQEPSSFHSPRRHGGRLHSSRVVSSRSHPCVPACVSVHVK